MCSGVILWWTHSHSHIHPRRRQKERSPQLTAAAWKELFDMFPFASSDSAEAAPAAPVVVPKTDRFKTSTAAFTWIKLS